MCTCAVSYKTLSDYTGTVLNYGEGAAGKVAASGQPLLIENYRAWEGRAEVFETEQPFRALLAAPLLWHGQSYVRHAQESRLDPYEGLTARKRQVIVPFSTMTAFRLVAAGSRAMKESHEISLANWRIIP